jgi:hypothetical protein
MLCFANRLFDSRVIIPATPVRLELALIICLIIDTPSRYR